MTVINLCNLFFSICFYCLRVVTVSVRVWIVSWLRQGIVIGHAHLVPGFAYIEPPPPEI